VVSIETSLESCAKFADEFVAGVRKRVEFAPGQPKALI
jgi:hypothetical protein